MKTIEKERKDKEIYEKYKKLVLNFFYKKTENITLSRDLTAETMCKIILNYDKKLDLKTIDNWVFTVSKNHFTDYIRKINFKKYKKYEEFNDENSTNYYNINVDYLGKLKELDTLIESSDDELLKNYYKNKYIYMFDDKTIMKELNFSMYEIKKYDIKLVEFFKKNVNDILFI